MKIFCKLAALSFLFGVVCLSCARTEHTEEITAEITAAQMEGRKAAAAIVAPEWKDTAELQKAILDVKARQSRYLIEGKTKSAEAFNNGFISTVRAVKPELADQLSPNE